MTVVAASRPVTSGTIGRQALAGPTVAIAAVIMATALLWMLVPHPAVPFIPPAVIIGVLLAVYQPFLLCVLFIAFSYFRIHDALPFLHPLHIPQLLGLGALISLAFHMFVTRSVNAVWSPELKVFLAFFLFVTVGVAVAVVPEIATDYWTSTYVKIGVMTFAIAWLAKSTKEFQTAGSVFLASGMLVACVALYNRVDGIDLVGGTRVTIGRTLKSPIGDPNDLSLVLLLPLAFALARLRYRTSAMSTFLSASAVVLIIAAIIATQSRGGLIGVVFTFLAIGHTVVRHKWRLWIVCLTAGSLLYAAMGIANRTDVGEMHGNIDESSMSRLYAWSAATSMAVARPLTGVGIENFVPNYDRYRAAFDNQDHAVHSTWFAVLAETGFPGLAIFLTMVWLCFRSINRIRIHLAKGQADPVLQATSVALLAGLAGFCASGTFLTQAFTWPLYIIIGLTTALLSVVANTTTSGTLEAPLAQRRQDQS